MSEIRIGQGFDAHRLAAGRRLVLCGVTVPFDQGLLGHSDADVAAHAVMDAVLGALALGDIGAHFPPGDPRFKDADSLKLLREVVELARGQGFKVGQIDVTLIAEAPKLAPYIPAMREKLAAAAGAPLDRVSVKATTTEGMGFAGRGEGMAAMAVALLEKEGEDRI
jgi:2-C-methyl-D-erythritol 2,4-cyclodiphosphate synthase